MDIILNLRQSLPALSKKLALAARYALDNPDRIALDSMRVSAKKAGVTSTTMLRLARQVGFENYGDFRSGFQSRMIPEGFGARAGELQKTESLNDNTFVGSAVLQAAFENVHHAKGRLSSRELSGAAKLIRAAPSCFLVGSSTMYWLAGMMKNTGSMVLPNLRLVGAEYSVASEGMFDLSAKDVVVGFGISPVSSRTVDAMTYAQGIGAATIAITDRPSSPVAEGCNYVLAGGTRSPHYYPCMAAQLSLVQALLATVVAEGDGTELEHIRKLEARRSESNFYLDY